MVNESTSGRLETYLDKSRKIRSKVIPSLMSKQVKEYQDSNDNIGADGAPFGKDDEATAWLVSFLNVDITLAELKQCKKACLYLFNANALLLKSVTPTLWTVGYAIPRHVEILFDRYGMGLGINSKQGREAKHVRLSEFAKHSTKSTRWSMVLRHDYMCNVWIRMNEPGRVLYTTHKHHYIPREIELETFCYCGFPICKG
ncbi:Hypothetical predicted protein [Paramuricea clavata]|uniref:Uncharacterized protein n=1 Tax=Paramuricea clavata TaxID=317549 RepID=A0A7D9I1B3_PARCT|nr:Hypothetical predicted protein [Paramuricea clavata]